MENIISQPLSLLPKGFDYYAGGHVHIVDDKQVEGYGRIVYPGPLFPNSFAELEKLERGGFYIVEDGKLRLDFTVDKKTGAKITGILGKRGALEKTYYEKLVTEHLEQEDGYKIFLFHSGIDELKPKDMENIISQPLSLLPRGFD